MWSKFKGDLYNSGQSTVDLRKVSKIDKNKYWFYKTDGLIWSSPIVDEKENIYLGSTEGCFYVLNKSGKLKWTYEIGEGLDSIIDSAATFGPHNSVIIPGGDGCLHCVDRRYGKVKWIFRAYHAGLTNERNHKIVNSFEGNVVYHAALDTIYAGSDNGVVYAVDSDGVEKWHYKTGLMVWALPVFDEENGWMAVGSLDGYIYFLHPKSGELLLKQYVGGEIKSTPAYDPKTKKLFVCSSLGNLHCVKIEIDNKKVIWQSQWVIKFGAEVYSSPSYQDEKIVIGTMSGMLECCSFDGERLWSFPALSSIASSPIISKDKQVIIGCKNGKLISVNLLNGNLNWSYQTNQDSFRVNLDSSAVITKSGLVCVGSYDTNLYCISAGYAKSLYQKSIKKEKNIGLISAQKKEIVLDGKIWSKDDSYQLFSLFSPIKLKIDDFEKGDLSDVIFTNKYKIEIYPRIEFESNLSSDRKYIYITPKNNWQPDVLYTMRVNTKTSNKLPWLQRIFATEDVLTSELEFRTPLVGNEKFKINQDKILMHSFYIHSPSLLETYAAAAFFHQKLLVDLSKLDQLNNVLNALITPYNKEKNEQSFKLTGEHVGDHFRLFGKFDIAVMGAALTVSEFYLASSVDTLDKNQNSADLIFQIPVLSIRENKKDFKLPKGLFDNVVDLRFKIIGSAECKISMIS